MDYEKKQALFGWPQSWDLSWFYEIGIFRPVVMNKFEKTFVICESFMFEERNTASYFVLKSNFFDTKLQER